jgi:hypothetical protein
MSELPRWVWEIVADLLDEEDEHPRLFFTSGAFEGYRQYGWCAQAVLAKVPPEVRAGAEAIRSYRRPQDRAEDPEQLADWERELLDRQCRQAQDNP